MSNCWVWAGRRNDKGYGIIKKGEKITLAHRLVYTTLVGPIPPGLTLDHLCRVRECVNPAHLEPVTLSENCRRGESPMARHARKTSCVNGHPFNEENTCRSQDSRGRWRRACRVCDRVRYATSPAKRERIYMNRAMNPDKNRTACAKYLAAHRDEINARRRTHSIGGNVAGA